MKMRIRLNLRNKAPKIGLNTTETQINRAIRISNQIKATLGNFHFTEKNTGIIESRFSSIAVQDR